MLKRFRWYIAALTVAAALSLSVLFSGGWSENGASASVQSGQTQTGGWALVNLRWNQVIAVYPPEFDRQDLYENHPVLTLVEIPADVTVEAHNTAYIDGVFEARAWGWWIPTVEPTATPTPDPTAEPAGTGTAPTPEPTVAPTPTATPDPSAPTLEDLQALIDQLQLQVIDLDNRLSAAEAEIATLTAP